MKMIIHSIVLSSALNIFLLLGFKKIRTSLPPPEIGSDRLVGFAQYFGYPLYFDAFLFFLLLFSPILLFIILHRYKNK
jgi:hypothetical protein